MQTTMNQNAAAHRLAAEHHEQAHSDAAAVGNWRAAVHHADAAAHHRQQARLAA